MVGINLENVAAEAEKTHQIKTHNQSLQNQYCVIYTHRHRHCVFIKIPSTKSETPTITGSNLCPALLATQCTPKARNPAREVPHILFTVLHIVAPAIQYHDINIIRVA